MGLILAFVFAKIGSKRIIGGFDSFLLVLLLSVVGIVIVLASRRLDDKKKDSYLMKKFTPIKSTELKS